RFAVCSALGEAGYAPSDAEHIGALMLPWKRSVDLLHWFSQQKTNLTGNLEGLKALASCNNLSNSNLQVSFEWYRKREYQLGFADATNLPGSVLTVWLNEDQFDDFPLLRLATFFRPLAEASDSGSNLFQRFILLGPHGSSTLRSMFS